MSATRFAPNLLRSVVELLDDHRDYATERRPACRGMAGRSGAERRARRPRVKYSCHCATAKTVCARVKHKCHTLEMKAEIVSLRCSINYLYTLAREHWRSGRSSPATDPTDHPTRINKIDLFIYRARGEARRRSIKCSSQNMYKCDGATAKQAQ